MQKPTVHPDWYEDGIEDGENLWRMDLPDTQIQLFATVTGGEPHKNDDPPAYTGTFRLFIEHDVRGGGDDGNERTKYSGEFFPCDTDRGRWLLGLSRPAVQKILEAEIAQVKALPDDPAYH